MDVVLYPEDITASLWSAYRKTKEYKCGQNKAIPPHHELVENQEKEGLKAIINSFIKRLNSNTIERNQIKDKSIGEWLLQWKEMHTMLFKHILKRCGDWRDIDVRFGSPGDENLYHIPTFVDVPRETNFLANYIKQELSHDFTSDMDKFLFLAQVHYQFIRIHPFADGNGRIARAIIDQLAIHFGFPPAIAGYPRHDQKRRELYHRAIRSCVEDPTCSDLSTWIRSYIDRQLESLA